jgi:GTPase Era involved in 16S rRNA processing
MGRARTGKSTVAKTLEYAGYIADKDLELFSETQQIEFHELAAPILKNGQIYNFNVIDTPGLYDKQTSQGQHLNNDSTTSLILECMRKDMTNIHAFAFVFNLQGGINSEDIESMLYVRTKYPSVSEHMMLILTHCEETSEEKREALVEDFFQHELVVKQKLKEFFRLGIFYMGCLRRQLHDRPDEDYAADLLENIIKMRGRLLNYLIRKETVYKIHDDPILRSDSRCSIS